MKRIFQVGILFFFILSCLQLQAQTAKVTSDKYRIRLGDKATIKLEAELVKGQKLVWPSLNDSLGTHFDILDKSSIDTVQATAGANLQLSQSIAITSFDTGMHSLPVFPFTFINSTGDSLEIVPPPLSIQVLTVPVDTNKVIKDIRDVVSVPRDYSEFIPWAIGALILIAILAIVWYFYSQRKKPVVKPVKAIPTEPAWEKALRTIQAIENEKSYLQGREKVYYSHISDTLRLYIEERFFVSALEFPTSDIIRLLSIHSEFKPETLSKLKGILELADLVKFAKEKPDHIINERTLVLAREFVIDTIPKPATAKGKEENDGGI